MSQQGNVYQFIDLPRVEIRRKNRWLIVKQNLLKFIKFMIIRKPVRRQIDAWNAVIRIANINARCTIIFPTG